MKWNKFLFCLLAAFFIYNCFPDGTSPRDKCKNGDPGGSESKRSDRDFKCFMYLLYKSIPNPQELPRNDSLYLSLCVDSQIKLNDCDSRTTLPIGIGDVK